MVWSKLASAKEVSMGTVEPMLKFFVQEARWHPMAALVLASKLASFSTTQFFAANHSHGGPRCETAFRQISL